MLNEHNGSQKERQREVSSLKDKTLPHLPSCLYDVVLTMNPSVRLVGFHSWLHHLPADDLGQGTELLCASVSSTLNSVKKYLSHRTVLRVK